MKPTSALFGYILFGVLLSLFCGRAESHGSICEKEWDFKSSLEHDNALVSSYKYIEKKESWYDAKRICESYGNGTRLLTIHSSADKAMTTKLAQGRTIWIGLFQEDREYAPESKSGYVWIDDHKCCYCAQGGSGCSCDPKLEFVDKLSTNEDDFCGQWDTTTNLISNDNCGLAKKPFICVRPTEPPPVNVTGFEMQCTNNSRVRVSEFINVQLERLARSNADTFSRELADNLCTTFGDLWTVNIITAELSSAMMNMSMGISRAYKDFCHGAKRTNDSLIFFTVGLVSEQIPDKENAVREKWPSEFSFSLASPPNSNGFVIRWVRRIFNFIEKLNTLVQVIEEVVDRVERSTGCD